MGCYAGNWELDAYQDNEEDFRRMMNKAEHCDEFEWFDDEEA